MSKKIFFSIVFSLLAVILGVSFLCIDFNKIEKAEQTTADDPIIDPDGYWIDVYNDFDTYSFVGAGTIASPYLISSEKDLAYLSWTVYYNKKTYNNNTYFKQTADLDMSEYLWQPIGIYYNRDSVQISRPFNGNYNGDGYSINGLQTPTGSSDAESYQGLFGYLNSSSSIIQNVNLVNVGINGNQYVGGVAGQSTGKIYNCSVSGIINGNQYIGGIAGSGYVFESYNNANISSNGKYIGGIAGRGYAVTSYNTGNIVGEGSYIGGIAGSANGGVTTNCFNVGDITGDSKLGGVVGYLSSAVISDCYSISLIVGNNEIGGVVGNVASTSEVVNNCYYGGNYDIGGINGQNIAGEAEKKDDLIVENFKSENFYINNENWSAYSWDFENVWEFNSLESEYPTFKVVEDKQYWTDVYSDFDTYTLSGGGTETNPYLIQNAKDLTFLSWTIYNDKAYKNKVTTYSSIDYFYVNVYFKQTADIDLNGYFWQPIGVKYLRDGSIANRFFAGRYDGGNFKISGLNTPKGFTNSYSYQGLFGLIGYYTGTSVIVIKNIVLINSKINGCQYLGGIIGYINEKTTYCNIINCVNYAQILGTGSEVGGIVGAINKGSSSARVTLERCANYGNVFGLNNVGGLIGYDYTYSYSTISNCLNAGKVGATNYYAGGIVGINYDSGTIKIINSYNANSILGYSYVGGIIGGLYANVSTRIKNCFNIADITGQSSIGGIIGSCLKFSNPGNNSIYVNTEYCYNTGNINAKSTLGSIIGYSSSWLVLKNNYYGDNCIIGGINNKDVEGQAEKKEGLTINNFKELSFYTNLSNWDDIYKWDFDYLWNLNENLNNGFPYIRGVEEKPISWVEADIDFNSYSFEGAGTETEPYLIQSPEDLAFLSWTIYNNKPYNSSVYSGSYYRGVYFKQTADLDMSEYVWQPIGRYYTVDGVLSARSFAGNYDGDGFAISGLFVTGGFTDGYSYHGLFSYVKQYSTAYPAEIKNINIKDSIIAGNEYVGAIVGYSNNGKITDCTNQSIVNGTTYVGGIVGYGSASYCFNSGDIVGLSSVGGLSGNGSINNSYNIGLIEGNQYVGGIVGSGYAQVSYNLGEVYGTQYVGGISGYYGSSSGGFYNNFNVGNVYGEDSVGGVIGYLYYSSTKVNNCYNLGAVNGTTYVGGIVGQNTSTQISNCYYGVNCSVGGINGEDVSGQAQLDSSLTLDNFKTTSFYTDMTKWDSSYAWDFYYIWKIDSNYNVGFPILRKENDVGIEFWTDVYTDFDSYTLSGRGSSSDPYLIQSEKDLVFISWTILNDKPYNNHVYNTNYYYRNIYFKQTKDLDFAGYYWKPIGLYYDTNEDVIERAFSGNYDGNGFTVSGLSTISGSSNRYSYQGLFGYVSTYSCTVEISNLALIDSNISGYQYVGSFVGYIDIERTTSANSTSSVTISNCYNLSSISALNGYVGGLVGYVRNYHSYSISKNFPIIISNSYNIGNVSGGSSVGGIVGCAYLYQSSTNNIYKTSIKIINTFNIGNVSGTSNVGGIVGYASLSSTNGTIIIKNNYNVGTITGDSYAGGIVGRNSSANIEDCFYGENCTVGGINSNDIEGEAEYLDTLTSANFKDINFFKDLNNWEKLNTWDFETTWSLNSNINNGYPYLELVSLDSIVYWTDVYSDFDTYSLSGSGSQEDPYLIQSAKDLAFLSWTVYNDQAYNNNVTINGSYRYYYESKYFKQTAEIDLSQYYWQPIGVYYNREGSSVYRYFSGNYDGQNYAISGLKTLYGTTNAYSYQGLFGRVYRYTDSSVSSLSFGNIVLKDSSVKGYNYVGGIIGYNTGNVNISDCSTENVNVLGNNYVGGIVGVLNSGTIYNLNSTDGFAIGNSYVGGIFGNVGNSNLVDTVTNNNSVYGIENIGGISGMISNSNITNLKSYNKVEGDNNVGGIVGAIQYYINIENSINNSEVKGTNFIGGIVGYLNYQAGYNFSGNGLINNGLITGNQYVGGIAGYDLNYNNVSASIKNSYNTGQVSGNKYVGGILGIHVIINVSYSYNEGKVSGVEYVGGISGFSYSGDLSKSYNSGEIFGKRSVGGIIGQLNGGTIQNIYNTGVITFQPSVADASVGGLTGTNYGKINNGYNLGNIEVEKTSYYASVGGVSGYTNSVINCFNYGNISVESTLTSNKIGGIVGEAYGEIHNCYNLASISGAGSLGGIIGVVQTNTEIQNCLYGLECTTKGINGQDIVGQAEYDESLTIDNFKEKAFYLDSSNWDSSRPWDFEFYWDISSDINNGYPYLKDESALPKYWTEVYDDFGTYSLSGSGTKSNPYLISSAKDLAFLSWTIYYNEPYNNNVFSTYYFYRDKYFKQTTNIDLSENYWQPIGITFDKEGSSIDRYFSGNYDGNGYSISGLKTLYGTTNGDSYQGLFGYLQSYSSSYPVEIKNVKLANADVKGNSYVGGVVGYSVSSYTTIINCSVDGSITGISNVGGIIGSGSADISDCTNYAEVVGDTNIGGIIGRSWNSEILNSCNFALLNGSSNVGGIVGIISTSLTLENCNNYGSITGENNAGGIVGKINITSSSTYTINITAVYNLGNVTGTSGIGGIIGQCDNSYSGTTINLTSSGVECAINGVNNSGVFIGESIGSAKVNLIDCYGIVKTNTSLNSVGVTSTNLIISNCVYIINLQDGTLNKNYVGDDFTAFAWLNFDSCPIPKDLAWSGDLQQKPSDYETSSDWILDMIKDTGWQQATI